MCSMGGGTHLKGVCDMGVEGDVLGVHRDTTCPYSFSFVCSSFLSMYACNWYGCMYARVWALTYGKTEVWANERVGCKDRSICVRGV